MPGLRAFIGHEPLSLRMSCLRAASSGSLLRYPGSTRATSVDARDIGQLARDTGRVARDIGRSSTPARLLALLLCDIVAFGIAHHIFCGVAIIFLIIALMI